jgi:hypothetical protein
MDVTKKQLLIFAGTWAQGRQYATEKDLDRNGYRVVVYDDHVLGISPSHYDYVCVGTWSSNPNVKQAFDIWQAKLRAHAVDIRSPT